MSAPENLLKYLKHHGARRGEFTPVEGGFITISLPGEVMRAKVLRVAADDAVVAKLDAVALSKAHTYQKGDIVPCRRDVDEFLQTEVWVVVDERALQLEEAAERFAAAAAAKAQERAAEREAKYAEPAPELPAPPPPEPAAKEEAVGQAEVDQAANRDYGFVGEIPGADPIEQFNRDYGFVVEIPGADLAERFNNDYGFVAAAPQPPAKRPRARAARRR